MPKYGVLKVIENKKYFLMQPFKDSSADLIIIIPELVKIFITNRIGIIPLLESASERLKLSENKIRFMELISNQIRTNPSNFEIFSFAILKVHLEKFACKLYRDTKTSAHDKGVDLSTNFGVVFQIKKLKLLNKNIANDIYKELQTNFSEDRIKDGNIVLVIDDISSEVKSFLINMKIQYIATPNSERGS